MDRLFLYKLMDNNSFINVCILREIETSTLPVAVGRSKPKEENHRPLIYQTLLLYQRVHLQDELVVLLECLLLVVGVLLLFVQLLAHVLDQLLHGGRAPVGRRGRSSSYSGSPSPCKLPRRARSHSLRRPIKGRSSSNSSRSSSPLLPHNV